MRSYGGIFGIIVLLADIYAILKIVQSDASTAAKAVWIVVILVLPILGFIAWWLIGPKGERRLLR